MQERNTGSIKYGGCLMKRLQVIACIIVVLGFCLLAGAKKEPDKWQYARINFDEFTNYSWAEAGVYKEAENIDHLCRELSIDIPQDESANLILLCDWAGSNGWRLVSIEQRRGYVQAWFKRPK